MEKVKEFIYKNFKYIILALCLILLLVIMYNVALNRNLNIDSLFYNLISNIKSESVTNIMLYITYLGSAYVIVVIIIILLIIVKNKKLKYILVINTVVNLLLNQILKRIFLRQRPLSINIIEESGYSFPSGHSMVSMAFYGLLIYIINQEIRNKKIRILLTIVLLILILLIGFSRIYLGVHYTSDVIGGFIISMINLFLVEQFILNKKSHL